ncbi:ATP-grasp domain-containing protein [Planococcus sp. SIMBA_160]
MTEDMNILILSCGTRNKIVQYFRKELNGKGKVLATDCSQLAPALYEADEYFIVPRMDDENYLKKILSICKEKKVKAVFSLIDPELMLLAENKEKFLEIGTIPVISSIELIELSFNKYEMYRFLVNNNFNAVKSYIDKEVFYKDVELNIIEYPVFVKPVDGSASNNINLISSKEEVEVMFKQYRNLMIQEYMKESEYGIDVYIDEFSNDTVAIFAKEKLKMRAGETDKSVSVKDEKLLYLVANFVKIAGFQGVIDIDVFKKNNEYYISEVNPRFGGGYPHAYECGVNIPKMIINNFLYNEANINTIGMYEEGKYMMKYNEILITDQEEMITKQGNKTMKEVLI